MCFTLLQYSFNKPETRSPQDCDQLTENPIFSDSLIINSIHPKITLIIRCSIVRTKVPSPKRTTDSLLGHQCFATRGQKEEEFVQCCRLFFYNMATCLMYLDAKLSYLDRMFIIQFPSRPLRLEDTRSLLINSSILHIHQENKNYKAEYSNSSNCNVRT